MARPRKNLPEDVLAQRLYLGLIERGQIHALSKSLGCDLSTAARVLIQQGNAHLTETLAPGEHSCTSHQLRHASVHAAFDLARPEHSRCFAELMRVLDAFDKEQTNERS